MNIAFDATGILGPMSKNRGIGNYCTNLFETLVNKDKENNYFMLNFFEKSNLEESIKNKANFQETYLYSGKDSFLSGNIEYKQIYGEFIKKFIKRNKIDLFIVTSPFDGHTILYEREWFLNVQLVAIVYDIIPYVFKKKYLPDKTTFNWYMNCVNFLKSVDRCWVISQSVKDDLINHLYFSKDKIDVIWGASSNFFKKIEISDSEKDKLYNRFGIKGKYFMCTGGDDERKNIAGLIDAFAKIDHVKNKEVQLVIVCKLSADAVRAYTHQINRLKLEGKVILTNFVSDNELLELYNLAYAMIFPSKYEGFGLPVVEAFACEIPVITSNNSSLVEIAGDAAILVNPFSVNDITRGMEKFLQIKDFSEMIERGKRQLERFNWDSITDLVLKLISELDIKMAETRAPKTIACFTPLPPIQSGISDYSVDILNELASYCDIDVYIDDGYREKCDLKNNISVYNYKEFNAQKYDMIIYQVGNSSYHTYMYDSIKKYPGIIELHDYNMHGVAQNEAIFIRKNIDLYEQYLLADYSKEEVEPVISNLRKTGKLISNYSDMELNGFVTNYAKKIIVHSDYAHEKLIKKDISRIVKTIPHYAKIDEIADSNMAKKIMKYNAQDIVVAAFGHIHTTKRSIPLLKAIARLHEKYGNVKCVFVGKLDEGLKKEFDEDVCCYHLGDVVKVTGYVSLDDFEKYIDAVDICVNLRYPYNGETSGSLMRILAKGKCVIVNDIGSFSELPDNACIKLPNVQYLTEEEEINKIYDALDRLVNDRELRKKLQKNARNYAEEYLNIKKIVKKYWEFLLEDTECILDEALLAKIGKNEVYAKHYTNNECKELASTLAYLK